MTTASEEGPGAEGMTPPAHAIDIGAGHAIEYVYYQEEVAGINEWHLKPDGVWCRGWVSFNGSAWGRNFSGAGDGWDVIAKEPLTITPSILCRACGSHGHIISGKWVPA